MQIPRGDNIMLSPCVNRGLSPLSIAVGAVLVSVLLSGCVTQSVRRMGHCSEHLQPDQAWYADHVLSVRYKVREDTESDRIQTIPQSEYKSSIKYSDVCEPYLGSEYGVEMKGDVKSIDPHMSAGVPPVATTVDVSGLNNGIHRSYWRWYHYPSQGLLVVSVPVDVVLSPFYGIAFLRELSHMQAGPGG